MNKEPARIHFLAGNFSGENTVGGEGASTPAAGTAPLRRWSVAELVARAVAARRLDGMGHD